MQLLLLLIFLIQLATIQSGFVQNVRNFVISALDSGSNEIKNRDTTIESLIATISHLQQENEAIQLHNFALKVAVRKQMKQYIELRKDMEDFQTETKIKFAKTTESHEIEKVSLREGLRSAFSLERQELISKFTIEKEELTDEYSKAIGQIKSELNDKLNQKDVIIREVVELNQKQDAEIVSLKQNVQDITEIKNELKSQFDRDLAELAAVNELNQQLIDNVEQNNQNESESYETEELQLSLDQLPLDTEITSYSDLSADELAEYENSNQIFNENIERDDQVTSNESFLSEDEISSNVDVDDRDEYEQYSNKVITDTNEQINQNELEINDVEESLVSKENEGSVLETEFDVLADADFSEPAEYDKNFEQLLNDNGIDNNEVDELMRSDENLFLDQDFEVSLDDFSVKEDDTFTEFNTAVDGDELKPEQLEVSEDDNVSNSLEGAESESELETSLTKNQDVDSLLDEELETLSDFIVDIDGDDYQFDDDIFNDDDDEEVVEKDKATDDSNIGTSVKESRLNSDSDDIVGKKHNIEQIESKSKIKKSKKKNSRKKMHVSFHYRFITILLLMTLIHIIFCII